VMCGEAGSWGPIACTHPRGHGLMHQDSKDSDSHGSVLDCRSSACIPAIRRGEEEPLGPTKMLLRACDWDKP
jgi:hypothetical protein